MKRRVWAYSLTGIAAAVTITGVVLSFCFAQYVVGAILLPVTLVLILCLAGEIVQDNFYMKSEALFVARRYEEERLLLERVRNNHLIFPFVRERYYLCSVRNALVRDDLLLAKSCIDRLRHGGDRGLKYKTAYATVLILLDEGKVSEARSEYEDFRVHNEHYAVYNSQLEMLEALFSHLFTKNDTPILEAAVHSPYPVIKRILGRHIEERTAEMNKDWGE